MPRKNHSILTIRLPRTHQGVLSHAGLEVKEKGIMSKYHLCGVLTTPLMLSCASNVLGQGHGGWGLRVDINTKDICLRKGTLHIGDKFCSQAEPSPHVHLTQPPLQLSLAVSQESLNSLKINDAPVSPGREA